MPNKMHSWDSYAHENLSFGNPPALAMGVVTHREKNVRVSANTLSK
jgi:hypothetical protein